jgi:CDP-paratose 2-epimerase
MSLALVTGSAGLIGSEAVRFLGKMGFEVIGIDNDMRSYFFGASASTYKNNEILCKEISGYKHYNVDIRNSNEMEKIFKKFGENIELIIHTAAQPSHDWAARDPILDFSINAQGTLILLEMTRLHCPKATFIFTSTNKVYGDSPNSLPLTELETRWELNEAHKFYQNGIDESLSIDQNTHSIFGVSKLSADLMVQEYGKYFGLNTVCFRGGCLTGPQHAGSELHGFLSYLMKCVFNGELYTIFGYNGKQVRDNIHSYDLVSMFWHYHLNPRPGEVYNAGGGRHSNCSILEAISLSQKICSRELNYAYKDQNRIGDHIWWISDTGKFRNHYPNWNYKYTLEDIMNEMYQFQINKI